MKSNEEIEILIVDDNLFNCKLMEQFLSIESYQIKYLQSGIEAIEYCKSNLPDLLLLDIIMPHMDGYEVCRALKSSSITVDIPIIFLSALTETKDKVKAFQHGAVDYIAKPFEPEEILARVSNHIRLSQLEKHLKESNKQLETTVQIRTQEINKSKELLEKEILEKKQYIDQLLAKSTELIKSQEQLHLSETRLKEAQKMAQLGMWEWRPEKDLFCSAPLYSILDIPPENKITSLDTIFDHIDEDDKANIVEMYTSAIKLSLTNQNELNNHKIKKIHEFKIIQQNGSVRNVEAKARAIFGANNNFVCIQGVMFDVTEQKQMQLRLHESQELFKSIFENSKMGIILKSKNGNILAANPAFCKLCGFNEDELQSRSFIDMYHPKDIELEIPLLRELLNISRDYYYIEKRLITKDKKLIWVNVGVTSIKDKDDNIQYLVSSVLDITESKETERKILDAVIKAEENEKKTFAQNLHDDLGPQLSSIRLLIDQLSSANTDDKKENLIKNIKHILGDSVQMIRSISNNLSPSSLIDYGLLRAITSFVNKLNLHDQISINTDFSNIDINMRLDSQIENVMYRITTELINNTIKHADADFIHLSISLSDNVLAYEYRDNGKGFDYEKIKETDSGLGLYNITNRLKTINGTYDFFSEEGEGMQFIARLKIL